MGSRGKVLLAAAALLLPIAAPLAQAEYCPPQLRVYGRASFMVGIVPPAEPLRTDCATSRDDVEGVQRTLPPATSQITVRVYADFVEPRLAVELDGLGWKHNKVWLDRYEIAGEVQYAVEWLYAPEPDEESGTLRVTARFPHQDDRTVEYRVLRAPGVTPPGP